MAEPAACIGELLAHEWAHIRALAHLPDLPATTPAVATPTTAASSVSPAAAAEASAAKPATAETSHEAAASPGDAAQQSAPGLLRGVASASV